MLPRWLVRWSMADIIGGVVAAHTQASLRALFRIFRVRAVWPNDTISTVWGTGVQGTGGDGGLALSAQLDNVRGLALDPACTHLWATDGPRIREMHLVTNIVRNVAGILGNRHFAGANGA